MSSGKLQAQQDRVSSGALRLVDDTDKTDLVARVARLESENQALREENSRAHQILRSALDYAIVTLDEQGCITGWNLGAQQVLGYTEAEVLGRSGDMVFTAEDRNQGKFTLELCRALNDGKAENERWHVRRDGSRFWASGLMLPLLDEDGQPNGFLNILRDRTEVQIQAERRELLMAEMNHRVKNTFAMVQAVAAQTSRHASDMADFQAAFGSRLQALAHSHDLLISGGWDDAPLRGIIEGALGTYLGEPGRTTIEGVSVLLPANLVVALTLAFHELATNAEKHGALSVPGGSVHVTWQLKLAAKGSRQVELLWRESGGPPVRRPERQGFGSFLLKRGLGQFGSSLRLDFQPDGVECHVSFPLGAGQEGKENPAGNVSASEGCPDRERR
ncbi:MAG: HWE histidine kinase domain-containing protein [Acetobacteraceae bacterium]|nr:HWE histidine kinase domain-containing protein [Acetobacteraceae bacterium]